MKKSYCAYTVETTIRSVSNKDIHSKAKVIFTISNRIDRNKGGL